jgi:hypothetical protein
MQRNEYGTTVQTGVNERTANTDPRETGSVSSPPDWRFQPRRRSPWRLAAFCGVMLIIAALIAWLTGGFSFSSLQKNLPTHTFALTGHGTLVVNEAGDGALYVHTGSVNQVVVRARAHAYGLVSDISNLQVQYGQSGNTITVSSNGAWALVGSEGLDLDITVPSNIDVTVHNNSANATIENVDGQINATTSSGDLHLNSIKGPLDLNTSSGDITLSNEQGSVTAQTSSGNIHLNNGNGPLKLDTSSGDIAIANEQGSVHAQTSSGNVQIKQLTGPVDLATNSGDITLDQAQLSGQDHLQTTSGDIHFSGTLASPGNYQMETDSGTIALKLPASSSFQLTTTSDSGDLHNDFATNSVGSAPYTTIGLKTTSGNMFVRKQ